MKKKGFTLIELLVVIAIIAMLLAILMPALNKVKKIAQRVVCGTHLKGLGTAMNVYAHDYDDEFPVQGGGGTHIWANNTKGWQQSTPPWSQNTQITVSASLYMLVRETDVSPKSFVCPAGDEKEFDGKNSNSLDLVQLYDFGGPNNFISPQSQHYPYNYVSYSYHMPYQKATTECSRSPYAASGSKLAAFAVMADKNPWFDRKLKGPPSGGATADNWMGVVQRMATYYITGSTVGESSYLVRVANSQPHDREGQNVMFADGHSNYEKTSDVGVKHDGIYVMRGGSATNVEDPIRCGAAGAAYYGFNGTVDNATGKDINPLNNDDSVLVNDDTLSG